MITSTRNIHLSGAQIKAAAHNPKQPAKVVCWRPAFKGDLDMADWEKRPGGW